jgi:putative SOS response-associated peptidase YedK
MPVILSGNQEKVWLESDATDIAALKSILKPYPADEMDSKPGIGSHNKNF